MFKKIHSDRDPRDTLASEIKKEFNPYFQKGSRQLKGFVECYPKFLFCMMVINIILSAILCFTVSRPKEMPKTAVTVKAAAPVPDGLDRIMQAGAALKQTIRLKKRVDSISTKKALGGSDSTALSNALDSLQRIHPTINF